MPSTPYDLVQDDQDLRVPLHAEQAFFRGITFQAKFVGWEEVPRPNTRAEIVQAMRRIRYECKVQNLKKRKVTIHVSVNGVRVVLKKRRRKKKNWSSDTDEIELLNHPIYRIFYVSHDSSDLKIFSYIARDASTDTFKCSVFKSHKKSQAMRIVRTVGQAFEVCHKFNIHKNSADHNNEDRSDISSSELLDLETRSDQQQLNHSDDEQHNNNKKDRLPATPTDLSLPIQRPNHLELVPQTNLHKTASILTDEDKSPTSPSSPTREISKLKDQLEQQALQTRQALAQLMLVREQLLTETNARIEAQARTQQLLQQNRELLEHLASLGVYNEQQSSGLTSANIAMAPQSQLQMLLQATATNANNNLASINQQINNLGTINQQLTSLSHQLSGLNQQTQNLHNFQHATHPPASSAAAAAAAAAAVMAAAASHVQHHTPNALTPIPTTPIPTSLQQQQQQQQQPSPIHLNITTVNATTSGTNTLSLSGSPYPSMNHLQTINSHLQQQQQQQHTQQQQYSTSPMPHINVQQQQQPQQLQTLQQPQQQSVSTTELFTKDLYQINQELLQRLQSLNLGVTSSPHHHHQQQQQQQHLNNGYINSNSPNPIIQGTASPTPNNSYFFANPLSAACAISTNHHNNSNNSNNSNNNNNSNYLSAPMPLNSIIGGRGNLTPSPMSTLNRNSYSNSPITDEMRLSIDQNLNFLDEQQQTQSLQQLQTQQQQQQSQQHQQQQQQQQHLYVKSLASQLTNLSTSNGNLTPTGSTENSRSSSTVESPHTSIVRSNSNLSSSHTPHYHNHQTHQTNPHKNNNNNNNKHNNNHNNNNDNNNEISSSSSSPRYHNTVMLKVTDESGNVTNQRKLSATPSFITRSTSEKVPNRSQIMSQVHRTAWARHTTK